MRETSAWLRLLTALAATLVSLMQFTDLEAQSLSASYAPGCDPMSGCNTARFALLAPSGGLVINTVAISFPGSAPRFAVTTGVGTFVANDDYGPFGGFTSVINAGADLFIDFMDTGDPMNPGFPFSLSPYAAGYWEVELLPSAATAPFNFSYAALLKDGSRLEGRSDVLPDPPPSTTVPEPSTVLLLSTGLLTLYSARRRAIR